MNRLPSLHRGPDTGRSTAIFLAALVIASLRVLADCSLTAIGITPLNDLGPRTYLGYQGGLYPRGLSVRPPAVEAAALAAAAQIRPLDAKGNPSATGKIVLLSTGMSNTTQEFASAGPNSFKPRADADPSKNPQLVVVDGAQGGRDATQWLNLASTTWSTADQRLTAAGVTGAQVQVAWIKHAIAQPATLGAFPAHAQTLQNDVAIIARNLKTKYPNLRLCYIASRTRAYTNVSSSLNPEPYAFESSYSVKWVIEDQIAGRGDLNWDPARGPVVAPLLLWGPYLWADGAAPRSDGFTWACSDLQNDFTHPSYPDGVTKVAVQLLAFFKTDPTATPWFLKSPS